MSLRIALATLTASIAKAFDFADASAYIASKEAEFKHATVEAHESLTERVEALENQPPVEAPAAESAAPVAEPVEDPRIAELEASVAELKAQVQALLDHPAVSVPPVEVAPVVAATAEVAA